MRRGFVDPVTVFFMIALILSAGSTEAQTPMEFGWMQAASISPGRYYHTATLLASGQVLVTGGRRGFEPLHSVRLFDPGQGVGPGTWVDYPNMFNRRERHQATLMPAGWILVTGGLDGIPLRDCELIDPQNRRYEALPPMNDVRYEHSATFLSAGKVLVVGSKDYDRGLASCEIFETLETARAGDPGWRWRRTGSLTFGRGKHRAVKLLDGRVLVIGGVHKYAPTATCEVFDPHSETWSLAPSMYYPREGHTATLLSDGRVLVTGGDVGGSELFSCEIFDPIANNGHGAWTLLPSTIYPRKNHTATLVKNRFLIVAGAWRTGQGDRSTEVIDLGLPYYQWYPGPEMLEDRSNHTATLLNDGRLILIGGELYGIQEGTGSCDISESTLPVERTDQPAEFALLSVSPNPFREGTSVLVSTAGEREARLVILDMLGRTVRSIAIPDGGKGTYTIPWDGNDAFGRKLPSGTYRVILTDGTTHQQRALHLIR